ncbi:hypothetical protein SISSUDRAFT_1128715 [Sistotremastrum suecicum HHB10207 ss-3]|uniref:Uncharacterized protein n=1 Tax=Sistotremastrum suecicum HHB10207 ss-3 TaxID=1314776 RepID=A0A166DHP7_9AGAM|nr:hypothetical protein SISSUDRAFT_1128715 [Sistotremastrum suecicum HHB10207 ss-3]
MESQTQHLSQQNQAYDATDLLPAAMQPEPHRQKNITPAHKYQASRSQGIRELQDALGARGFAPPRSIPGTLHQASQTLKEDGITLEKNKHLVQQFIKYVSEIKKSVDAIYAHIVPEMASKPTVAQADAPASPSPIGVLNMPRDTSTLIGGYLAYDPYPLAFPEGTENPPSFIFRDKVNDEVLSTSGWNGTSLAGQRGPDILGQDTSMPRFAGSSHMPFH